MIEATSSPAELSIPRSAVRVLAACATAASLGPGLGLDDPVAQRAFECLGGHTDSFSPAELVASAYRALVLDTMAESFFETHPDGIGVGVLSLLGTRSHRLARFRWANVDPPRVAALRNHLLPHRAHSVQLACCPLHSPWVDAVTGRDRRKLFLILDESAIDLPVEAHVHLLDKLVERVAVGSEMAITFAPHVRLHAGARFERDSPLELRSTDTSGNTVVHRYPRVRLVHEALYAKLLVPGPCQKARGDRSAGLSEPFATIAHFRFV
ncbi:MAG TPA: hypothetical protein VIM73_08900 [Polyangiaceae bacterium]